MPESYTDSYVEVDNKSLEERVNMKILFLLNRFPGIGGIENITSLLAYEFKSELHHETMIFSVIQQESVPIPIKLINTDIPVIVAGQETPKQVIEKFQQCLACFAPDIIIFQDSYAEIEYLLDYVDAKIKLYTVEHSCPNSLLKDYIWRWKRHNFFSIGGAIRKLIFPFVYTMIWCHQRVRHRYLIKKSNKYILLSESYIGVLKNCYKLVSDKVISVPNIKNELEEVVDLDLEFKEKQVLFVGRLSKEKGLDLLIDIWSEIETRFDDYRLIIVGDGVERDTLMEYIARYELKHVSIEGFKTDVSQYYKKSSILLMTSIFEGFPLVIPEAMTYGVIPFAYNTFPSIYDVIEDKVDGFIIDSFDKVKYVDSIVNFIEMNTSSIIEMRKSASRHSDIFSKANVLKTWAKILK